MSENRYNTVSLSATRYKTVASVEIVGVVGERLDIKDHFTKRPHITTFRVIVRNKNTGNLLVYMFWPLCPNPTTGPLPVPPVVEYPTLSHPKSPNTTPTRTPNLRYGGRGGCRSNSPAL
eukprot:752906-Hanusia_phi.AAC.3